VNIHQEAKWEKNVQHTAIFFLFLNPFIFTIIIIISNQTELSKSNLYLKKKRKKSIQHRK
jgi:hypothetical protein